MKSPVSKLVMELRLSCTNQSICNIEHHNICLKDTQLLIRQPPIFVCVLLLLHALDVSLNTHNTESEWKW